MSEKKKAKDYYGFKKWEVWVIVGLLICSILSPFVFTQFDSGISFIGTGEIGDTIGGLTAPFINLIAAFLVYKSFTAQIQANLDQRDNHDSQMKIIRKEQSLNTLIFLFNEIEESVISADAKYHDGAINKIVQLSNEFIGNYKLHNGNQELIGKLKKKYNINMSTPISTLTLNIIDLLRLVRHLETYATSFGEDQNTRDLLGYFLTRINKVVNKINYSKLNIQSFLKIMEDESHLTQINRLNLIDARRKQHLLTSKLIDLFGKTDLKTDLKIELRGIKEDMWYKSNKE